MAKCIPTSYRSASDYATVIEVLQAAFAIHSAGYTDAAFRVACIACAGFMGIPNPMELVD